MTGLPRARRRPAYLVARVGVKALLFRGERLLLLHRRPDLDLGPGAWDLPGGGVEKDEPLLPALRREILEETGYRVRALALVDAATPVLVLRDGERIPAVILYFRGEIRSGAEPRLDPAEHTEHAWVGRTEARRYRVEPHHAAPVRRAWAREGRRGRS